MDQDLDRLLQDVQACRLCEEHLPLGPRPVVSVHPDARILIIGQAPGTRVHASGIPWDDASGNRLREWMGVDRAAFYDASRFAIVPMGFCYPGRGTSGDLPPRPECAPTWHPALLHALPHIRLTVLLSSYAISYYLGNRAHGTVTETVRAWKDYLPTFLPMPHPSPRNNRWLKKNPWFEAEVVPELRRMVAAYST